MKDIVESMNNDKKDIKAIIDEYKKINEEIDRLFDARILPLPEEYITPKNKINYNKYKSVFNDFYNYKMTQYP